MSKFLTNTLVDLGFSLLPDNPLHLQIAISSSRSAGNKPADNGPSFERIDSPQYYARLSLCCLFTRSLPSSLCHHSRLLNLPKREFNSFVQEHDERLLNQRHTKQNGHVAAEDAEGISILKVGDGGLDTARE